MNVLPITTVTCSQQPPAGALFHHGGGLIRPSQYCGKRYVHSIVFNEITRLEELHFEEHKASRVGPTWRHAIVSCTICNQVDYLNVVDAMLEKWGLWQKCYAGNVWN